MFNDHYGTAQSTLDGILRATNLLLAGRTVVVLGYGLTGRGIALRARGAGAQVVVCEVDPIAGLDARMEGFEVMPSLEAARRGDIFITVTGAPAVLGRAHFEAMKDGAVLANAGHFDVEIDLAALRELGGERRGPCARSSPSTSSPTAAASTSWPPAASSTSPPARAIRPSVMDISFALQALSVEHLAAADGTLPDGVQPVPDEIDREVARLKLASLGVQLDELTAEQRRYRRSWE